MDIIQTFIQRAGSNPQRIVFPESVDSRILQAARLISDQNIADPILVGIPEDIEAAAAEADVDITGLSIQSNHDESLLAEFTSDYAHSRDMREAIAHKLVRKPLSFAGMMLRNGYADGMVAGIRTATSLVIQTATLTVGFQQGLSTPSSFFIMIVPHFQGGDDKVFVFADPAVAIQPDARQLSEIAVAAGDNASKLLGTDPQIAFLSFSTKGSASHADVDKVLEALALAKAARPAYNMDGELQLDAAIIPSVAAKKVKESTVAGQANVLVFPDLDSANIGYKLVQYMADAKAIGPILQGFAKPVNDMSRGASVQDLVAVSAITAVHAQGADPA